MDILSISVGRWAILTARRRRRRRSRATMTGLA
jgi:hypothetical protein